MPCSNFFSMPFLLSILFLKKSPKRLFVIMKIKHAPIVAAKTVIKLPICQPNANPPGYVSSQAPGIDKSTAAIYIRIYIKDAL